MYKWHVKVEDRENQSLDPCSGHSKFIVLATKFLSLRLFIFSVLSYVIGAQKNRLIETVLLSTSNIYFG